MSMDWEFEGMTVKAEGQDRFRQTKWVIYRADGSKLGEAYSTQGVKRMISKANGTATCDCGHIPQEHYNGVAPYYQDHERWIGARRKSGRLESAEHGKALYEYAKKRYQAACSRVHANEKAWRAEHPNFRELQQQGLKPNFYDNGYHFWNTVAYRIKKHYTHVDKEYHEGMPAGCSRCNWVDGNKKVQVCSNSPSQARAAGKRRAKERGLA